MTNSGFNFDELGDRLGVDDETRDIARPAPARSISEILQPPALPAATRRPPAAEPKRSSPRTSTSPRRSGERRELGERSSANLPVGLVEQLARYKHRHRWELSQLIDSALTHLDPGDVDDPDAVLNEHWRGPRSARHYQLQRPALERLDAVGERWRMNRSQTITVLVVLEAGRLGLTVGG